MTARHSVPPFSFWCGEYRFGRDNSFFPRIVAAGQKYADMEPGQRPPEARFRTELEALRANAPAESLGLLDQLEYRWANPHCPPSLYVLTCTLTAPLGGALVGEDGEYLQELVCTKVGKAKRTIAARIDAYKKEVLGGVPIAKGTPSLHAVIFGDDPGMLTEREVQAVARYAARRAEKVLDGQSIGFVGSETYAGLDVVDALHSYARQRGHH